MGLAKQVIKEAKSNEDNQAQAQKLTHSLISDIESCEDFDDLKQVMDDFINDMDHWNEDAVKTFAGEMMELVTGVLSNKMNVQQAIEAALDANSEDDDS